MGTIAMTSAPGTSAVPQAMTVVPMRTDVWNDVVKGTIESVRKEIDDACEEMETLYNNEPDHCLRIISGHSARLSHIAILVRRIEDREPQWRQLRERELETALRELERQYDNASRRHTMREFDFKVDGGMP